MTRADLSVVAEVPGADRAQIQAVVEGAKKGLDEGLRFESKCFGEVCGLEDMRIGMDNFMKNGPKARAEFKNR